MAAASDTLALAAEERAKQGIHELEISFGGEPDLHKHYNNCHKNPGHHKFFPVNKLEKYHIPEPYGSNEIIDWVRRMSAFTVKLSVNYVSPNRPPGYPLSSRAGQRVLTVGSGYMTDIRPAVENGRFQQVRGYIIVATAAHVVFDDEEAKNTIVEFFYDDPDDRRGVMTATGVKVGASSVEGDFCELLCVTHDTRLLERFHYLWKVPKHKERRICELFQHILPGLEHIELLSNETLKFLVRIRVRYPFEAVEALVVLGACTEEVVDNALTHWKGGRFRHMLKSNMFKQSNFLNMINFELHLAKLTDDNKVTKSYLQLHNSLVDLRETVRNTIIGSSQTIQHAFTSLVIILAEYYSTAESVEKRLYLQLAYPGNELCLQNRQKVVNIGNGTATVEVTLLRAYERFDMYRTMEHMFVSDSGSYECESEDIRELRETGPDNTERNLHDIEFDPVDSECKPDDTECQPSDTKFKPYDAKCKLEAANCRPNDLLLIHIAHPHGQSKQVTIGRQTDCFTGEGFYHQRYTAPTCPGCSGGPVWMLPACGDPNQVYGVPHSGHHGNELNTGSSLTIYPPKTLLKYPSLNSREAEKWRMRKRYIHCMSSFEEPYFSDEDMLILVQLSFLLQIVLICFV